MVGLGAISNFALAEEEKKKEPDPFAGKRIRSVNIEIKPIFDGEDLQWFYREVNDLKIDTKEEVVRRELLVKEGDTYDKFRIDESVRILRTQRFLRKAAITAVPVTGSADEVDLNVSVQDTWTLIPQVNYSSGTGQKSWGVGLAESNVLGYGKRAELLYSEEDSRNTVEAVYDDPRVLGTFHRVVGAYFDRSDGQKGILSVSKPFRSFVDKQGWSLDTSAGDTVGRLFLNGDERQIFQQDMLDLTAKYTYSFGNPEKRVERVSFGYAFDRAEFAPPTLDDYENLDLDPNEAPFDPNELAEDRKFSGPLLAVTSVEPEFVSRAYIDRFDRVMDYNLGRDIFASLTYAPEALGSEGNWLLFSSNYASGINISDNSFYRNEYGLSTRMGHGDFSNTLLRSEFRYYYVFGPLSIKDYSLGHHTFATGLTIDYGLDLDLDREFTLGAGEGLRGYETRTFAGERRILFNAEQRVHIAEDLYRLVSVGAAAFTDVGAASDNNFSRIMQDDLYADAGVGLRFNFPRSSGSKVLRIDVAVPFRDANDDNQALEFRVIFTGGQPFSADLRSERVGSEAANVEVGFDK